MLSNRTNFSLTALLGLSVLLAAAPSARAQNALGDGSALDRNLNPASGGKNPASIQPNFADRNLIVTRDVAAGRGFRGVVGYSAPADFRAALGSNDTFDFRADAAFSDPALFRMGTTYEQLKYGQDLGMLEFRRSGSGDPVTINAQSPMQVSSSPSRQRLDRTAIALTSTTAFQVLPEPRVVGLAYGKDNQLQFYSASPLRGLMLEQANQSVSTIGLSIYDAARIRQDVEAGGSKTLLGNPYQIKFETPGPDDSKLPDPEKTKSTLVPISPDYQRLVQRIADRYAERTNKLGDSAIAPQVKSQVMGRLTTDYQTLTNELITEVRGGTPGTPGTADATSSRGSQQTAQSPESIAATTGIQTSAPGTPTSADTKTASAGASGLQRSLPAPGMPTTAAPGSISSAAPGTAVASSGPRNTAPGAANQRPAAPDDRFPTPGAPGNAENQPLGAPGTVGSTGAKPTAEQPAAAPPATLEDFGVVLHHGERIEHLSAGTPDRFNELLTIAEQKLREGDYFAAERNFDRAQRFTPGHPLAMVGAAHAQLGAGLYLSSAYSLRNLFSKQPEMIDVTYAPDLLPNRERLDAAIAKLKDRLRDENDRDSHGFLLAYIGHQIGDRALVDQGLGAWAQAERGNKLLPLVRSIWLAQPSSQTAPPENPEK